MLFYKLILVDHYGQTCNRFWSYVDTVAWAITNHKHIAILSWDKSIEYYDNLRKSKYVHFPLYLNALVKKYGAQKLANKVDSVLDKNYFQRIFDSKIGGKLGFIKGWQFRNSYDNILLCKDQLVNLFCPNSLIKDRVDDLFNKLRDNKRFIIGLHIRRGDYSTWMDGKYFYSFDDYLRWMNQLVATFQKEDRKVCFYISANEHIPDSFSQYNIHQISNATVADDLYALQLCDIILGPTSSFSRGASFLGNVPLHIIWSNTEAINEDTYFCPVKVLDKFIDGTKVW